MSSDRINRHRNHGHFSRETSIDGHKKLIHYKLEDFDMVKTIGTGTFARVCLCRDRTSREYFALKILAIHDVIRLKQVEHVKNEKNILKEINHPFLVDLTWSSKDKSFLYMLFPYVSGGELFSYLRSAGRFNSATTFFYSAEIVSALDYLHSLSVVYRDLKPENLLLDRDGHLKITDFGFAKRISDRTWTLCGTPEYLAPEIIQSKGHNRAVDWWALEATSWRLNYSKYYRTVAKSAEVVLVPGGDSGVTGKLSLSQKGPFVIIQGKIYGLSPGEHGFHIHMNGSLDNNCKAAGGHFNPDMNEHSFPLSSSRHAGDLGNIVTPEDTLDLNFPTFVDIADSVISLGDGGVRDVAGRAFVVHAGRDDLGFGVGDKAEGSKKTGNAGGRVACGIIELLN